MSDLPAKSSRPASDAEEMRIQLLGGFRVWVGQRLINDADWRLRKAKTLVKLLALSPDHLLHREQVMDRLWPDMAPRAAANNLHKTLYTTRRIIEDSPSGGGSYIHLNGDLVSLDPPDRLWVDTEAFRLAVSEAHRQQNVATYSAAMELYSGDLLPEDLYEEWTVDTREQLKRMFLDALTGLARLHESSGNLSGAIETLNQLVARDPTHEHAHSEIMRLQFLSGRRHLALQQFERLKQIMKNEVGVEPDQSIQRFHREILEGVNPTGSLETPSLLTGGASAWRAQDAANSIVGREEELRWFEYIVGDLFKGRGRVVLLSGAAGIGKSRLAAEVAQQVSRRGGETLWGTAYEEERQLAYGPFVEAIKAFANRIAPTDLHGLLGDTVSEIARLLPTIAGSTVGEPTGAIEESDRQRLFSAVTEFFNRLAYRTPTLLVLDDLHAADEATLELLHYLIRTAREAPLVLIAVVRSEAATPETSVSKLAATLDRQRWIEKVSLRPLNQQDSGTLVSALLGGSDVEASLLRSLFEIAEGNPFYTAEVVRSIREEDSVELGEGRWRLRGRLLPVPNALSQLVETRIARLREPTQRNLRLAATIGRDIPYQILRNASDLPEPDLLDALDEAMSKKLLEEAAQGYRFAHPLHRAVLYQGLSRPRREFAHSQVASAIESIREEDLDDYPETLAYHYSQSNTPYKAVPHLLTAARRADSVFANEQADRLYRDGIRLIRAYGSQTTLPELATFQEELGDVVRRVGGTSESVVIYEQALATLSSLGDDDGKIRVRGKAALSAMATGDVAKGNALMQDTLNAMNEQWPLLVVARTYYQLSQLHWHSARHDEALESAQKALEVAISGGGDQEKAHAYEALALACHSLGDWQKGIEYELNRAELSVSGFDTDEAFDAHL